jgi:hypothetical protein
MRKSRYQKGSVKKQDGRWVAMWWVDKSHKSRVIGLVKRHDQIGSAGNR